MRRERSAAAASSAGVEYYRYNVATARYDTTASFLNPRPFDLYYFDSKTLPTQFRIRGTKTNDDGAMALPAGFSPSTLISSKRWAQVAGVNVAILESGGGGGSAAFDSTITIGANDMIYLYMETTLSTGVTVTYLERYNAAAAGVHKYIDGGDAADLSKAYLYIPLWLIEWDTDHIARLLDLREIPRSDRAGN
jgi:hypothetical protein